MECSSPSVRYVGVSLACAIRTPSELQSKTSKETQQNAGLLSEQLVNEPRDGAMPGWGMGCENTRNERPSAARVSTLVTCRAEHWPAHHARWAVALYLYTEALEVAWDQQPGVPGRKKRRTSFKEQTPGTIVRPKSPVSSCETRHLVLDFGRT